MGSRILAASMCSAKFLSLLLFVSPGFTWFFWCRPKIRTKPNILPITTPPTTASTAPTVSTTLTASTISAASTASTNSTPLTSSATTTTTTTAFPNSTNSSETLNRNIEIPVAVQLPDGTKCSAQQCSLRMKSKSNEYTARAGEKLKVQPGLYEVKLNNSNKFSIIEHPIEVTRTCNYTIVFNNKGQEDKLIEMCNV